MAIGMLDLYKAINAAWDASTLDTTFKALWDDPEETEFFVLCDQEAPAEQPNPYVVMEQLGSNTQVRMSGGADSIREIRDVEVRMHIYASATATKSSKQVAGELAEDIMKVFGGHPTVTPTGTITLDNGGHLITTYQNDFCIQVDEEITQWVLIYNFRLDVPVAVG